MKDKEYMKLLENALNKIPKKLSQKKRFEIPKINSVIQGSKTVLKDFIKVVRGLRRNEKNFSKVLAKNLGTSFNIQGNDLILKGKFSSFEIQKLFEELVKLFILCRECQRPDTKIIEQNGVKVIKCEACGAIMPLKEKL